MNSKWSSKEKEKDLMVTYESARSTLEELELIEGAIAARLRRNPEIFYRNVDELKLITGDAKVDDYAEIEKNSNKIYSVRKTKRTRKQILAQEHEIQLFLEEYRKKSESLRNVEFDLGRYQVTDGSVDGFLEHIETINSEVPDDIDDSMENYTMFSNSTAARRDILSKKARALDINAKFTREEQYGEFLDLEPFHQQWLSVVKDGSVSLLQFLGEIEKFTTKRFLLTPAVNRGSARYQDFVKALLCYLQDYLMRAYPLQDWDKIHAEMQAKYCDYKSHPEEAGDSGLFCIPCDKTFKAETVYRAHLTGKKHINNMNKKDEFLAQEYKLHMLCCYLVQELVRTREFVERKLAFTPEERRQEMERLTTVYESPVYGEQEQEDIAEADQKPTTNQEDSTPEPSFDLPLGPDGFPIPYWLYKLQGLDIEYPCEVCGNLIYKGRRQFDKHFTEQRHIFGLKRLGVDPSPSFKGVTSIDDVKQLWAHLRSSSKASNAAGPKFEEEIEDEEGNVMSKKVYEELKKQGLI